MNKLVGATTGATGRLHALAQEYRDVLRSRGRTPQYVAETHACIARLLDMAGVHETADLNEAAVQRAVGKVMAAGRSRRTCDKYLVSMRSLCGWMVRNGYLSRDPTVGIPCYKAAGDRRHRRTSFTYEQLAKLLLTTAASTRSYGTIDGRSRAELYHTAACTGLRAGTLRMLTVDQFHLDVAVPFVRVYAEQMKDREDLDVPIQPDSAARLAEWFRGKAPADTAFRLPKRSGVVRMLRRDLADAGIAYCRVIQDGERVRRLNVLDFHSFRHTFGTMGAMAGVALVIMQRWMGHSDPKLTANLYSHVLLPDTIAAVARLRKIG